MGTMNGLAALGVCIALAPISPLLGQPAADDPAERIYGRVLTATGETYEGFLRWDRNETHWADLLDGRAFIPKEHALEAERLDAELRRRRELERSVSLPGLRVTWDEDDNAPLEATEATVRFAQILSIEPRDRRALLTLQSGEEIELASYGTDVGRSFRALIVEAPGLEAVELEWDEISRVELVSAPPALSPPQAGRLHGTLRTVDGEAWTGFVAWDLDESLTTDVLDGETADGDELEIAFGDIASIGRESRSTARVRLTNGEEHVLRGTNDVDDDIRGIEITDPSFGRIVAQWEVFESLELHPRTVPPMDRESLAAHGPLRGTVAARDGTTISGLIRWDNDEEYAWEALNTHMGEVDVSIELGRVRSIATEGSSAAVTLRDGRTLRLTGSDELTDIGDANRGIFVTPDAGETILVRWRDLVSATFDP